MMTMVVIRVTLFGDSAGAASAGHLMLSQEATGLFHQVFNPMKGAKPDLSKDLSYQISVQFVFSYFYMICIALHELYPGNWGFWVSNSFLGVGHSGGKDAERVKFPRRLKSFYQNNSERNTHVIQKGTHMVMTMIL